MCILPWNKEAVTLTIKEVYNNVMLIANITISRDHLPNQPNFNPGNRLDSKIAHVFPALYKCQQIQASLLDSSMTLSETLKAVNKVRHFLIYRQTQ